MVRSQIPPQKKGPDLVTFLKVTGNASQVTGNLSNRVASLEATRIASQAISNPSYISVPIKVVVRNQGDETAYIFKISTEYTDPSGTHTVAFRVPGESNSRYPYTDAPLDPGKEAAIPVLTENTCN